MESRERLWLAAGICLGVGVTAVVMARRWKVVSGEDEKVDREEEVWPSHALAWKERLDSDENEARVQLREWDDPTWRKANGWKGEERWSWGLLRAADGVFKPTCSPRPHTHLLEKRVRPRSLQRGEHCELLVECVQFAAHWHRALWPWLRE